MLLRKLSIISCMLALSACVAVGNGERTLILPCQNDSEIRNVFPEYTSQCTQLDSGYAVTQLTDKSDATFLDFGNFVKSRYGDIEYNLLAELDTTIRQKESIPYFLSEDANAIIQSSIKEVELNSDLKPAQKNQIISSLRAKLLNIGRMPVYSVSNRKHLGADVYHYFPRVEVDFSAKLRSTNEQDSFKRLGIVVKLKQSCTDGARDCEDVKFVDYSPKEPSIVEFSRGQLAQSNSLAITPSISDVAGGSVTDTIASSTVAGSSLVRGASDSLTRGLSINYTNSEAFTNQLVDALEQRTTGIIDGGKSFFASYRSTKNKRISGTFTYDLMLEVPAKAEILNADGSSEIEPTCLDAALNADGKKGTLLVSVPCNESIRADVYVIGVVRHVYDRGFTGVFTRVPEVENDDVFEHLVVEKIEDVSLWDGEKDTYWFSPFVFEPKENKSLTIHTNHTDAQFKIVESGVLLKVGGGKEFGFKYEDRATDPSQARKFTISPLDILIHDEGGSQVYTANELKNVVGGNVVLEYEPK